jgi:hypothetical protein
MMLILNFTKIDQAVSRNIDYLNLNQWIHATHKEGSKQGPLVPSEQRTFQISIIINIKSDAKLSF